MDKETTNKIIMKSEDDYERLKDKAIMYEEDMKALRILLDIKTKRIQDLMNRLEKRTNKIDKAIETINYYAIEDENYGKIYNTEEQELLNILKGNDKNVLVKEVIKSE